MSEAALAEVKKEIDRRSRNFEKFFRAGQAAELVNDYYVDEPIMSAPDMPLLTSRNAITDVFSNLVQTFSDCTLFYHDVRMSGERAYELGGAVITPKDTSQPKADCRYVIIWRKVPDGWRVETDFFAFGKLV